MPVGRRGRAIKLRDAEPPRRIRSAEEFRRHLRFSALETLIIKRLVKPFNDLVPHYTDYTIDAHHFIADLTLHYNGW